MSLLKKEDLNNVLPKDGPTTEETIKYLEKYTEDFIVIKMGGSVLSNKNLFANLIQDIVILKRLGLSIFLIHGGGSKISKKLNDLNIKSNFIEGLRVTDDKIIDIVENVLVNFNKEIVNALKNQSCNAKEINTKENNIIIVKPENNNLGFVGKPTKININALTKIIKANEVPVIASLGLNENNQAFNINADSVAVAIAKELKARRLLMLSDVEGVLNAEKKLIPEINLSLIHI